jgi:hypothetical protein
LSTTARSSQMWRKPLVTSGSNATLPTGIVARRYGSFQLDFCWQMPNCLPSGDLG